MFGRKPKSPFAGWPATKHKTDRQGRSTFTVRPAYLTPEGAKAAQTLGGVTSFAFMVLAVVSVANTPGAPPAAWIVALVLPWIAKGVFTAIWKDACRRTADIRMTADRFSVRRGFRWEHFDRTLPHKFALVPHDKARAEREMNEYRKQKAATEQRKAIRTDTWYGEAFHLSFDYLGQRNDILTIYGRPAALALRDRLKACDDVLEAERRQGEGVALSPDQEWGEQPGAIPQEV